MTTGASSEVITKADSLWIGVFLLIVSLNLWLGAHNYFEARNVADTKIAADTVLKWFASAGEGRAKGSVSEGPCQAAESQWIDCRNSLISSSGPLKDYSNLLNPTGEVFADACDRSNLKTLGAIVVERGVPKASDVTQIVYQKISPAQTLSEPLSLKLYVCGRSFHPMIVGETVF